MTTSVPPEADVVVVGAGLAGMVAALELGRSGQKVVLLDRGDQATLGGLARDSFGGIFVVDSPQQRRGGFHDTPELAFKDWVRAGEMPEDDSLSRSWAEQFVSGCRADVYDWLVREGVRFFPVVHWVERGQHEQGNTVPRFHMVWGTGDRLVEVVAHQLGRVSDSGHVKAVFGRRVDQIERSAGGVDGVSGTCVEDGRSFRIAAPTVVLACGGYTGNMDWVRSNWDSTLGPCPPLILNGSHPAADGALHVAVRELGGWLRHLDRAWLYAAGIHHPKPQFEGHGLSVVPPKSAVWLDAAGRRIGPEPLVSGYDTRFLVEQVCRTGYGYSWQVMNWRIAKKELAISGAEYNQTIRDRRLLAFVRSMVLGDDTLIRDLSETCRDVLVAETPDELAGRMSGLSTAYAVDGVDRSTLIQSLQQFDEAVTAGPESGDDQLRRIAAARSYRGDRVRTLKSQPILDPRAGPLVAVREYVLSRKSLGGMATDLNCRVLNGADPHEPIPGLYAVGEAAGFGGGGIHGIRSLEGTFLGSCVFTGRVAARHIMGS
jgi:predicted oxidoreductase